MENNFNLKKFLVENKLTANSRMLKENASIDDKKVDLDSLEVEGIHRDDFPDFVDAYIVGAEFEDGTPLTGEQVEKFNMEYPEYIQEFIHDRQLYSENSKELQTEKDENSQQSIIGPKTKKINKIVDHNEGLYNWYALENAKTPLPKEYLQTLENSGIKYEDAIIAKDISIMEEDIRNILNLFKIEFFEVKGESAIIFDGTK